MIRNLAVFVFFVLVGTSDLINSPVYSDQWAVHIDGDEEIADKIAEDHGFVNLGKIFGNYYHFMHRKVSKRSLDANQEHHENLISHPNVKWAEQQVIKSRVKRDFRVFKDVKPTKTSLNDPRWPQMWYLNRGGGLDMNVQKAWSQGVTGKGVVVTILDDGLERDHPDIKRNYDAIASFDVNNQDEDPQPRYDLIDSNRHGTRCAGEVAADANNSICAVGVAYDANVGGVRMLDGDVTDAVEARSLSLRNIHIDIYSASWGPDDDGKTVDGPGDLATKAFIEGVKNGRNGLGSIFVWASGNGGREHDNCNCDGYTNSIWTLSISSATENGLVPWYSEACSSTLATTYSSGSAGEKQVVTTDLHHGCTSTHTGTSASAPLAAGICALALQINRRLTWRDMQHIVVRTARPANLLAADWATNGVGRNVSHSFGYGLMDANAMVELAKNWTTVPEQKVCEVKAIQKDKLIPAHSEVKLDVHVDCHHILYLEHVQAKISLTATRRGDIRIFLISPMGTRSTLLDTRVHDNARNGFQAWPFMTVHCWGENPAGKWILEIHNEGRYQGRAMLHEWMLVFYGTTEDPDGEVTTSSSIPSTSLTNFLSSNSTTTTSTPSSTHVPLSHLSMAVESGGEVLDSNVLHGGLSLDPSAKQTIQNDAAKAKEWQLILYGTKEDPQQKSFQAVMNSSCIRLSASGACLECTAGLVSNGTACQKTVCPEQKFLVDEENNLTASKEKICLPCHYSCKSCLGPNDYQCLSCFGDAIYENGFCFPNNLVQQLHFFQHWQFGMTIIFFIMAVIVVILVIAVIWLRSTLTSAANYIKLQQEEDRILCAKPYTDLRIKDDATVEIFHDTEEM